MAYKAGREDALADVAREMVAVDDKWSIVTQNAGVRDLMQWCFREYRDIVTALRG